MRFLKIITVLAVCVLGTSLLLSAGPNKFGVMDSRQITFDNPMRVGDVVLPSGEYQVLHTMDGDNHIMVFKQLRTSKPAEAKVKCTLVPLPRKRTRLRRRMSSTPPTSESCKPWFFEVTKPHTFSEELYRPFCGSAAVPIPAASRLPILRPTPPRVPNSNMNERCSTFDSPKDST